MTKYRVEFFVAKGRGKPLFGLRASEQIQLISMVRHNIMAIQSEMSTQFETPLSTEAILEQYAEVYKGEEIPRYRSGRSTSQTPSKKSGHCR